MRTDPVDAAPDLERTLASWLQQEGPQDVPDRIVDAALSRAAGTERLRTLPEGVTRLVDLARSLAPVGSITLGRRLGWAGPSIAWVIALTVLLGGLVAVGSRIVIPQATVTNGPIAFDSGGDIWLIDPTRSSTPSNLTSTAQVSELGPVWSPDGRRLAYSVTAGDVSEIHVVDAEGRLEQTLTAPAGSILPPDDPIVGWSPDGRSLAVPARGGGADDGFERVGLEQVVVFDVATGIGRAIAPDLEARGFGWSPDGRWIGLVTPDEQLYVVSADGGQRVALSEPGSSDDLDRRWSSISLASFVAADRVAFTADLAGVPADGAAAERRDADVLMATRDEGIVALVEGPTNDVAPRLSPDGRVLTFGRSNAATAAGAFAGPFAPDAASRRADLYLVGFGDGRAALPEPAMIAMDVWPDAAWSPDGRRLATKSSDWKELVLISLADHEDEQRFTATGPGGWIGGFSWRPIPP